ncbi:MAG TPA: cyclic nucleotide-binding domain-containing protein [Terriglobales bacterium]|nr:cyclic nucleotide-binding domain-containing protein [Terriglobales bacterium]
MAKESPQTLGPEIWRSLAPITATRFFSKGQRLFRQGSAPEGVYMIERGEVALIPCSAGKPKGSVELVGPGTVLGLSESVSGRDYQTTAEACQSTTVSYIERQELMAFLREHCDICMQIVRLLSDDLHVLYHKVRTLKEKPVHDTRKVLRSVN